MGRKKNMKRGSAKKRKYPSVKRQKSLSGSWAGGIMQIYLIVMLGVFPLYFHKNLFNLGTVKYIFFRTATLIMLALLAVELASSNIVMGKGDALKGTQTNSIVDRIKKRLSELSLTDIAVLVYTFVAMLSWGLSEWRSEAWIGADGWFMGLLSQLLLVGIYFAVSRFCLYREWMLWVMAGSGALVFLLAYLHRFSIDFMGLRNGNFNLLYLGTIGQATLHSNYVCVVLSFVMGAYLFFWQKDVGYLRLRRGLSAAVVFLGFCTAVTQNSDSIYVGLGIVFLFFLWFAMEDGDIWRRYLELILLAVSAAKFTDVLQNAFPERVLQLDPISLAVTKGGGGWLALAAVFLVYVLTCLVQRKADRKNVFFRTERFAIMIRRFRMVFYLLLALAAVGLLILIGLVTEGKVSVGEGIFQKTGYLLFNEDWGSGRGSIWLLCAGAFSGYSLLRKLFGCGPDMLANHLVAYHEEALRSRWGDRLMRNAHNEWFNAVLDYGLVGGAAYILIFISAIARMIKRRNLHPVLLASGGCVLGYMAHNIFCYQQAVCASLIFIVLGLAEGIMRRGSGEY